MILKTIINNSVAFHPQRNSETVSPQLSKSENRLFLKKNGAIATKKNGIASLESIDPITPKIEEVSEIEISIFHHRPNR